MKNPILRTALAGLTLLSATAQIASAKPQYLNSLISSYPKVGTSSRCATCHSSGGGLNFFGHDVAKYALINNKLDVTKVKDLDSDKDGITNNSELSSGTNPGISNNRSL